MRKKTHHHAEQAPWNDRFCDLSSAVNTSYQGHIAVKPRSEACARCARSSFMKTSLCAGKGVFVVVLFSDLLTNQSCSADPPQTLILYNRCCFSTKSWLQLPVDITFFKHHHHSIIISHFRLITPSKLLPTLPDLGLENGMCEILSLIVKD